MSLLERIGGRGRKVDIPPPRDSLDRVVFEWEPVSGTPLRAQRMISERFGALMPNFKPRKILRLGHSTPATTALVFSALEGGLEVVKAQDNFPWVILPQVRLPHHDDNEYSGQVVDAVQSPVGFKDGRGRDGRTPYDLFIFGQHVGSTEETYHRIMNEMLEAANGLIARGEVPPPNTNPTPHMPGFEHVPYKLRPNTLP